MSCKIMVLEIFGENRGALYLKDVFRGEINNRLLGVETKVGLLFNIPRRHALCHRFTNQSRCVYI